VYQARFSGGLGTELGNRNLRQLLWHRHRVVQARTWMMNHSQAVALSEGLRCKNQDGRSGTKTTADDPVSPMGEPARRHDLLELLDRLNPTIAELSQAIEKGVENCPEHMVAENIAVTCFPTLPDSRARPGLTATANRGQPFEPTDWSQLVAMMPYQELACSPGTKFQYSNPAFIYLARVIEELSGDRFEVYLQKNSPKCQMHKAYKIRDIVKK
jgi:hypothetical protein